MGNQVIVDENQLEKRVRTLKSVCDRMEDSLSILTLYLNLTTKAMSGQTADKLQFLSYHVNDIRGGFYDISKEASELLEDYMKTIEDIDQWTY